MKNRAGIAAFAATLLCVAGPAAAAKDCPDYNPRRNPYFGDLHIHTAFSFDAVLIGVQAEPNEAYAFAKGEPLELAPAGLPPDGLPRVAQLERPLDFAAVTDHAEFFGEFHLCTVPPADAEDPDEPYNSDFCMNYRTVAFGNRDVTTAPGGELSRSVFQLFSLPLILKSPTRNRICRGGECVERASLIWEETQEATRAANDRCTFSAFNAYEWTGNTIFPDAPGGAALHRNVVFRGKAVPSLPASYFEAPRVELLWDRLREDCLEADPRCDALTIPHNTNKSSGRAFKPVYSAEPPALTDRPLTKKDAKVRASFEPVVEVIQQKGDSECRIMMSQGGAPFLGGDELCDFEKMGRSGALSDPITLDAPLPRLSYVREGLKEGLVQEQELGVNPFKLGMLGSTDTHNATGGMTNDKKYAVTGHKSLRDAEPQGGMMRVSGGAGPETNPGGLAVVWAEENSRDAIFDAIQRKEVYATSGARPIVRFFGGWKLPSDLCERRKMVKKAYKRGVPMGGDLPKREGSKPRPPRFLVSATKDPGTAERPGTDLQRIQIVKGWVDEEGEAQEAVYDVAGDSEGGAGVDVDTCEPEGTGSASLCTVWKDPDFDPGQGAFYYARILDSPTCRWNQQYCADTFGDVGQACDAGLPQEAGLEQCCDGTAAHRQYCADELGELAERGVSCGDGPMPPQLEASCCAENYIDIPQTVQERAWSSPIWYTP